MSHIGKQPIPLPEKVEVTIENGRITLRGPKGELTHAIHPTIEVGQQGAELVVRRKKARGDSALWGLSRALIFNMAKGVTDGFQKRLEVEGVGYRAQVEGDTLVLSLGFSHPVEYAIPKGIRVTVGGNAIEISGIDKALVGQVAADIRGFKKPEPYKGKGIRYAGERIRRKQGKKAGTT